MERELPVDPLKSVELVERLVWCLTVYRLPDECCPVCQGDLEVFVDSESSLVLACNVLGCARSKDLTPLGRETSGRRPADRKTVLEHYPEADLVPVGKF